MSLVRGIAVDALGARSPLVTDPGFGACIGRTVCTVCRIRIVRTCCAARSRKAHLAGGGWRAFVQAIAIRKHSAVHALRKRRGRQSDRHQRCGNKQFVVHRSFHPRSVPTRPRVVTGPLSRSGQPHLPLGSYAFFEAIDLISSTCFESRRASRTPAFFRPRGECACRGDRQARQGNNILLHYAEATGSKFHVRLSRCDALAPINNASPNSEMA
jgi:hypothetical protein